MSIKILIPTPLRPYVNGQEEVSFDKEGTLATILEALITQHESLKKHLFDQAGQLRKFVNVYVNDEDIRYQKGTETPVKIGDTISIIPSIAGGLG